LGLFLGKVILPIVVGRPGRIRTCDITVMSGSF
jgi:hypothetical protein